MRSRRPWVLLVPFIPPAVECNQSHEPCTEQPDGGRSRDRIERRARLRQCGKRVRTIVRYLTRPVRCRIAAKRCSQPDVEQIKRLSGHQSIPCRLLGSVQDKRKGSIAVP